MYFKFQIKLANAAEYHAMKTQHVNFSESTLVIQPLSAEEKALKVKQLQELLKLKREEKRLKEIEEEKSREKVRRKTGQEIQALKEKMEQDELKKAVIARTREKEEDKAAKERIRALLEADKLERQRKLEEKKNSATNSVESKMNVIPKVESKEYNETRIQIRLPQGPPLTQTFHANDPLSIVYEFIVKSHPEMGSSQLKLATTFPRKVLDGEKSKTLKELGLVPSAALVAQF